MKMELKLGNTELETKEKWKRVVGYNDYVVSNKGRVYSLKSKKFMSQHNQDGYRKVDFSVDGKYTRHFVHILVAKAFIINPYNKKCVNHKDLNKSNNNLDNLEWVTHKENTRHAIENGAIDLSKLGGTVKRGRGEKHSGSKLNDDKVREIRKDERGCLKIAKEYGVDRNTIRDIKRKITWIHVE